MPDQVELFKDFPPTSKSEWLAKIEKDLKGRPLADLQWHLSESIRIDPFFHPDDEIEAAGPLIRAGEQNNWEIGEYVAVNDSVAEANQRALTALTGGAEALLFQCGDRVLSGGDLNFLLKDIELGITSIHFEFSTTAAWKESLPGLEALVDWRGSVYSTTDDLSNKLFVQNRQIRNLVADGRSFYQSPEQTTEELAQILKAIRSPFELYAEQHSSALANRRVKLLLAVDTSYFLSIAKIRALKILWANFVQAYGVDPHELPEIEVHLTPYPADSDPHTNMIRAATQTLSAAIGGADRIFVTPADSAQGQSTDFTRRIARNVQHLLKMESYIDRVIDPAAGSYYIEKLTGVLAAAAWGKFRQV